MKCRFILLAAGLCLAWPAAAAAGPAPPKLWATVNACDTAALPDTLGVRASMPGNGTRQRVYMRFQAQWYDQAQGVYLSSGPATGWIHVGSARFRTTQAGYSFAFDPPPIGTEFTLRGLVSFQWRARRNGKLVVVRRERRITKSGIRGVEGGDPLGSSAATCVIRG